MKDVADFVVALDSASVPGDLQSNNPLWHGFKILEVYMKYGRFVAQLSIVHLECDTWRSLAQEQSHDINHIRSLLGTSMNKFKQLQGHIEGYQIEKDSINFEPHKCNAKVDRLQGFSSHD